MKKMLSIIIVSGLLSLFTYLNLNNDGEARESSNILHNQSNIGAPTNPFTQFQVGYVAEGLKFDSNGDFGAASNSQTPTGTSGGFDFGRYNSTTNKYSVIHYDSTTTGFDSNNCLSLAFDANNNVAIGTDKGIIVGI